MEKMVVETGLKLANVMQEGRNMRYFFYQDQKNITHIIVARSLESALKNGERAGLECKNCYELKEDTFKDEGFLV